MFDEGSKSGGALVWVFNSGHDISIFSLNIAVETIIFEFFYSKTKMQANEIWINFFLFHELVIFFLTGPVFYTIP